MAIAEVLQTIAASESAASDEAREPDRDRRAHRRYSAAELDWLRSCRLKSGPRVALVDLSATGALFETTQPLRPGVRSSLEIVGRGLGAATAGFRLLRCEVSSLENGTIYRSACVFDSDLTLPASSAAVTPASAGASPGPCATDEPRIVPASEAELDQALRNARTERAPAPRDTHLWNKLVARYLDGRLVKGYSLDFLPSRGLFHVVPLNEAGDPFDRSHVVIPLEQLKAAFFVRDFAGNPARADQKSVQRWPAGRRLEVTFLDGEVIAGSTLSYREGGVGFFVTPADTESNNVRLYVVSTATRSVRFL
ncbi:MAG TPA: hypothetical protein VHJ77_12735 [Vicinamibacterales bacterium]|jgi:hypothetical protein|nr:hypothetical protein [Vicinamibacterales bacterium]